MSNHTHYISKYFRIHVSTFYRNNKWKRNSSLKFKTWIQIQIDFYFDFYMKLREIAWFEDCSPIKIVEPLLLSSPWLLSHGKLENLEAGIVDVPTHLKNKLQRYTNSRHFVLLRAYHYRVPIDLTPLAMQCTLQKPRGIALGTRVKYPGTEHTRKHSSIWNSAHSQFAVYGKQIARPYVLRVLAPHSMLCAWRGESKIGMKLRSNTLDSSNYRQRLLHVPTVSLDSNIRHIA